MSRHITPNGRGMGWRPSIPVHHRLTFASPFLGADLPRFSINRESGFLPPVYDQGQTGSCTGNALAGAVQYERAKQRLADAARVPSRLFIYYGERDIEGTTDSDSGAQGYDGIQFLTGTGTCFEDGPDGWPFDPAKVTTRPSAACYAAAPANAIRQSLVVPQDINQIRGCLAAGFLIPFGFVCYPELDSDGVAASGVLPMPGAGESPIGAHEVVMVDYDDDQRGIFTRNSWGPLWGQNGYFWLPYEYVIRSDLAMDFESIRLVSS